MKRLRSAHRLLIMLSLLPVLFIAAGVALAHPLGNFTISRYSELAVGDEIVSLVYIIDMAEIPSFQERPLIDTNRDDVISDAESATYRDQKAAELLSNLTLSVDGQTIPLTPAGSVLTFPPGQGDLDTLRLEVQATAVLPTTGSPVAIAYEDGNYTDRLGWREIVINTTSGQILESTVPIESISDRLRDYPADLLQAPPEISTATASYAPTGSAVSITEAQIGTATAVASRFNTDEFGNLLSRAMDTPTAIAAVLALAFVLGAVHALTPGHGKTIVGAYLVGSRGTARHALLLGLTTTVTHTAGVFALGLVVLGASRFILPEKLFPWLGVASGLLVATIGFSILRGHIGHWRSHRRQAGGGSYHYHFGFGHSHDHDHASQPIHQHDSDHDHDHTHDLTHDNAGNHSIHDQDQDHEHDGRDHVPALLTSNEPINMRSLLALGISGGMIPCPSALVLLLSAVALGQVGTGLVLIVAFSLGLAGVLTAIGVAMVYAGRVIDRLPLRHSVLTQRVLPIASATFITIAGTVIALRALLEMGFL